MVGAISCNDPQEPYGKEKKKEGKNNVQHGQILLNLWM